MDFKYQEAYKYPTCICLNLTDNCNLACKYCFVQQKPHFMTFDIAKKAVDWTINNLEHVDKEYADITFFGGEPMLMYDEIIVPLTYYIEENYKNKIKMNITTNGTLLNGERIKFLYNHNINILLSIDGDKETQDFNRPQKNGQGSFDLINNNIPLILKYFPNTTFRGTLNQQTVKNTYNNYKYAQKMGFNNIFLCPNAREEWEEEHILELKQELNKVCTDMTLNFLNNRWPIHLNNLDEIFCRVLEHDIFIYNNSHNSTKVERKPDRCGLGSVSASVNYCGDIFACQEQDSRDTGNFFYIGNIFDGIDINKHKKILEKYSEEREIQCYDKEFCNQCMLRNTCYNDICPSVSYDLYGDFFIRPKIDCLYSNFLANNAIAMMEILVKQDKNKLFKEYLDNIYIDYWKEGE